MPNLVGTGLNQVPSNSMLGGMAYQDSDRVKIKKLHVDEISQMIGEIGDSATDVFLYDTSKDSDGGAWRHRTQHLSWYNEPLGTEYRGTRREFPSVAVLVVINSADEIVIYDGDDPNLSMWMRFKKVGSGRNYMYGTGDPNCIAMVNGAFVTGAQATNYWPIYVDFLRDECIGFRISGGHMIHGGNISERNTTDSDGDHFWSNNERSVNHWYMTNHIQNQKIESVAMTVLSDAPIDETTGLARPTILLGSDGGTCLIKSDGSTVNRSLSWRSDGYVSEVEFDKKHGGYWYSGAYYAEGHGSYPNHGGSVAYESNYDETSNLVQSSGNYQSGNVLHISQGAKTGTNRGLWNDGHLPDVWLVSSNNNANAGKLTFTNQGEHFGSQYGLTLFDGNYETNNDRTSLGAYITADYNTGWMYGDCRGVFLADTVTEKDGVNYALTGEQDGTNRLTSLTYSNGDTSWQMVDNAGSANGYVVVALKGLTVGQSYEVSMTWDNNAVLDSGYSHRIAHKNGTSDENDTYFSHWNFASGSSVTVRGTFVAQTANNDDLVIYANGITLNVSNFSVVETDNIYGVQKIPNPGGPFSSTSNWQSQSNGGTLSVNGGKLRVACNGNYQGCQVTTSDLPTLVEGRKYIMTVDVAAVSAGTIRFGVVSGMTHDINHSPHSIGGDGVHSTVFVAGANTTQIYIDTGNYGSSMYFELNSVTIREAELDRSVYGGTGAQSYGMQVYGNIYKDPVAPGAELLAYSNFSNDNYLVQAYNVHMQTGTTGFTASIWFNTSSEDGNYHGLMYYNNHENLGEGWQIMMDNNTTTKGLYFYVYGPTNDFGGTPIQDLNDGTWHCVTVTHTNGSQKLYIDGVLRNSGGVTTGSTDQAGNTTMLHIGRWNGNTTQSPYYFRGSLALAKFSVGVADADSVRKMYEGEKHLFYENAKCTLYGTSSIVRDVAYDEKTGLLHVGTSGGRSDFRGLRRINNTTTAVTTAISAHDGFIVEQ